MAFLVKKTSKPKVEKSQNPILKWLGRFFMGVGIMAFISFAIALITLSSMMRGGEKVEPLPNQFALVFNFDGSIPDFVDRTSFIVQLFPHKTSSLHDFLVVLDQAKTDDRVTSFVAKLNDGEYSLTQIETIREAVLDFRESGKKAYIYAETIGGLSNGLAEYWLASAFDEIWVQPVGMVSVTGLRIEQPFIKDALDKVGVNMQLEQRKLYKTAAEMYTRSDMSDENKESLTAMTDVIMTKILNDITNERGFPPLYAKKMIDQSPMTLSNAQMKGMITNAGYADELEEDVKQGKDKSFKFVGFSRYKMDMVKTPSRSEAVAVIRIDGMILDEDVYAKGNDFFAMGLPSQIAAADEIARSIMNAADDETLKVIILRINSPGGSPSASETIRRAVVRAKEKGKYVIASMGDMAASGGYWIAVNADEIIASDLTITGSIGVYGGKPDLSELWNKIGVNWGVIEYGQNAGMWSVNTPYSETELRRLSAMMDEIYKEFVDRVVDGRGMNIIAVEKAAKGRAWIGQDAQSLGLIDRSGGLKVALSRAAQKTDVKSWRHLNIRLLPNINDPWADIADLIDIPIGIEAPQIPSVLVPFVIPQAMTLSPMMTITH
jgi:protease-4